VSCYGYERKTTPNLDRLASEGVLFEKAFAHSSHTLESIPSLLASCFPSTHKMNAITNALPRNLFTLPEIFKAFGYKTAFFSSNPYVSPPFGYNRGVERFIGPSDDFVRAHKTVFGHLLKMSPRVFGLGKITGLFLHLSMSLSNSSSTLKSTDARYITEKAINWITNHQKKPFFIYLHYEGGHAPYHAPEKYQHLFSPDEMN
jgi:arylsulfatase A-like enzyme